MHLYPTVEPLPSPLLLRLALLLRLNLRQVHVQREVYPKKRPKNLKPGIPTLTSNPSLNPNPNL